MFFFLTDIQECYEVTLQLNAEQSVVREDSGKDAWEVILQLHIIDASKDAKCLPCLWCGTCGYPKETYPVTTCVPHTGVKVSVWCVTPAGGASVKWRESGMEGEEEMRVRRGLISQSLELLSLKQVFAVTWTQNIFSVTNRKQQLYLRDVFMCPSGSHFHVFFFFSKWDSSDLMQDQCTYSSRMFSRMFSSTCGHKFLQHWSMKPLQIDVLHFYFYFKSMFNSDVNLQHTSSWGGRRFQTQMIRIWAKQAPTCGLLDYVSGVLKRTEVVQSTNFRKNSWIIIINLTSLIHCLAQASVNIRDQWTHCL